ncbi:MAG: MBL fold metallo-hydrolase [Candidatus Omnitrophica bacterium]|nr:MBL fold metallo-hydrolase [Candidatus Omnitrophota bacterium]
MKVQILFDNEAAASQLSVGWGLSCLVDGRVLFDTGESDSFLFNNIDAMNVDVSKIKTVVISHDHWDHWGGLWGLLGKRKGMDVYGCPGFGDEFKDKVKRLRANLKELSILTKIDDNIFSSGEIPGEYGGRPMPEQALVLTSPKGLTIITGCAHPGIVKMVKEVKLSFPEKNIYAVLGGFHLMDKDRDHIAGVTKAFRDMKVKKAGPTHCSGKEAEAFFKDTYKEDFIAVKSGVTLEV